VGAKWGKYLRAPDVFFQILDRGKDKLCRLSEVADVRRGFTTGANAFFYVKDITDTLSDAELKQLYGLTRKKAQNIRVIEAGDGSTHLIEAEYLKPVIQSLKEAETIIVDPRSLGYKVVFVSESKRELSRKHLLRYVNWGEEAGRSFHTRPTCAARSPWYKLEKRDGMIVFPRFFHVRTPILLNQSRVFVGDVFFEVSESQSSMEALWAVMNSTLYYLSLELFGRVSLGDGVLTVYGPDMTRTLLLDPRLIDNQITSRLIAVVQGMTSRPTFPVFHEIDQPDRQELDGIVLEALGFTDAEERKQVQEALYGAVTGLVRTRLEKAQSVRAEERKRRRASAEAIAEDLLQEFDPAMLKSFPKDFTPRKYVHTVIALPPGADDFERLTMTRLAVGEKLLEFDEPDQALFLHYALQSGARETVQLPTHEPTLQKAVRQYTQYLNDLDKHLNDLASSRTRDRKLKARIKDALRQKLSLPAAPEQQMRLL